MRTKFKESKGEYTEHQLLLSKHYMLSGLSSFLNNLNLNLSIYRDSNGIDIIKDDTHVIFIKIGTDDVLGLKIKIYDIPGFMTSKPIKQFLSDVFKTYCYDKNIYPVFDVFYLTLENSEKLLDELTLENYELVNNAINYNI